MADLMPFQLLTQKDSQKDALDTNSDKVVLDQSPISKEQVEELPSDPKGLIEDQKSDPGKELLTDGDAGSLTNLTEALGALADSEVERDTSTILKNVRSVVLEGISAVKIIQTPGFSSKRYNVRFDDTDDSDAGGSDNEGKDSEEKDDKTDVDSKIRFTVKCQNRYEHLVTRYQKNHPSDDVDLPGRPRKRNSTAPVVEQVITFSYWEELPPLSEMNEDDIISVELVMQSPLLINAFRAVVQYYCGESLSGNQVKISHPYAFAFHHRDQLKMYKGSPRLEHTQEYNEECDNHIDVFLEYLEKYTGLRMDEEEARWQRKVPVATFQHLWYLLKPGEDVYAVDESGAFNAFVVKSVEGTGFSSRGKVPKPYTVKLWRMDFDGKWIGQSTKLFTIRPFEGEREITKLDVFPVSFYEDQAGDIPLRDRLIARGRKFFEIAKGPAYREYNGLTRSTPRRKYNRARVMIDNRYEPWTKDPEGRAYAPNLVSRAPNLVARLPGPRPPYGPRPPFGLPFDPDGDEETDNPFVPGCRCPKCEETNGQAFSISKIKFHDYDYINPREVECLTEHQLLLCPAQIYGYVLKDRHWHLLELDKIELPNINEKAIDWLVMSEESDKNMIKAICQQYTSRGVENDNFAPDIIEGKGEGQIFLLHGPPGTGKTLTAECVAEFTRRPLISITAGDLGSDPARLERNLEDFFRQGTDWDAIVLLDEADVYLEARQAHDLERNGIVSVFLRSLEYYQGILFITTNRIGTFDEAFASRIHIQLHYRALDDVARLCVWENNFKKLKQEGHRGGQPVDVDRDAKDYIRRGKDVKELAWNGREIRNAFQTAIALAVYETKEGEIPLLKEEHLEKVVKMSAAFKKYVKDVYKMTVEERAAAYNIRAPDALPAPERSLAGAGSR